MIGAQNSNFDALPWILNHYWEIDDIQYKLRPIFVYNEYHRNVEGSKAEIWAI